MQHRGTEQTEAEATKEAGNGTTGSNNSKEDTKREATKEKAKARGRKGISKEIRETRGGTQKKK